jgi:hypothetical protein
MTRRDPQQQKNLDGYNAPPIPWERVRDHLVARPVAAVDGVIAAIVTVVLLAAGALVLLAAI